MSNNTIENVYEVMLSVQMIAQEIEQTIANDLESYTLFAGIADSILECAETASELLSGYLGDEKSGTYTANVAERLRNLIADAKED